MSKRRHPRPRLSKRRLFIAIRLPPVWRRELRRLTRRLQRRYQLETVRWLPHSSFHLTLLFLGWVPNRDLGRLEDRILQVTRAVSPFLMETADLGIFPNLNQPGTLWLGIGNGSRELTNLHRQLYQQLHFLRLREADFEPHLTLAKFNEAVSKDKLAALLAEKQTSHLRLKVTRLALMESFLHPEGAVYHQRRRFNFSAILKRNGPAAK